MRIGASLFLIAVGAILAFAVKDTIDAVDLRLVGIVLMIVGAIGLLAELVYQSTRRRTTHVVHEGAPVVEERVVRGRRS